jgi:hypothetical protein
MLINEAVTPGVNVRDGAGCTGALAAGGSTLIGWSAGAAAPCSRGGVPAAPGTRPACSSVCWAMSTLMTSGFAMNNPTTAATPESKPPVPASAIHNPEFDLPLDMDASPSVEAYP